MESLIFIGQTRSGILSMYALVHTWSYTVTVLKYVYLNDE